MNAGKCLDQTLTAYCARLLAIELRTGVPRIP